MSITWVKFGIQSLVCSTTHKLVIGESQRSPIRAGWNRHREFNDGRSHLLLLLPRHTRQKDIPPIWLHLLVQKFPIFAIWKTTLIPKLLSAPKRNVAGAAIAAPVRWLSPLQAFFLEVRTALYSGTSPLCGCCCHQDNSGQFCLWRYSTNY